MILLQIFLGLVFLVSTLAVIACMYALSRCTIVTHGSLSRNSVLVEKARSFVDKYGGLERVRTLSERGIQQYGSFPLLSLAALLIIYLYS
jgi:hypothetical protein